MFRWEAVWPTINLPDHLAIIGINSHTFRLILFNPSLGEGAGIVQGGEVVSTKLVEGGSGSLLGGKEGTYKARKEHLKSHLK